jgi:hypothetical protein
MGASAVIVKSEQNQTEANVSLAQAGAGSTVLATAVLGRRHRVAGLFFTMTADGTVKFTSGGVDLTGPMDISAKGGMVEVDLASLIVGAKNQDITIVSTGGGVNGVVKIVTEDAP